MAGIPVVIGSSTFQSKAAARDYVRANVIDAFDGAPRIPIGPIHDFVDDLLNLHPDATDKIGSSGVNYFRVDPASVWKVGVPLRASNRTLVVVRNDGSSEDWSWDGIITNPSPIAKKRTAMRNAAYDRIQASKRAAFAFGPIRCARTGATIANPDDAQVKYRSPSFAALTDGFASTVGGWIAITTTSSGAGAELAAPTMTASWIRYYDANAIPSIERKY
jgi:hypothetical protein